MSQPLNNEKGFWKFYDSLPEIAHDKLSVSPDKSITRLNELAILLNQYNAPSGNIIFLYVKTSAHFSLPNPQTTLETIHTFIQDVSAEYCGFTSICDSGNFLLVIPTRKNEALKIVEILAHKVLKKCEYEINCAEAAICFGASIFPDHGINSADLIRYSMLSANHCVSNREIKVFDKGLDYLTRRRNLILRSAAELLKDGNRNGQLYIHYQPKFSVDSGKPVGFEALSRWTHNSLGEISPSEFIPIIEQNGLIYQFTRYVVEKAVSDISVNLGEGIALPIAVNISLLDLEKPGFVNFIKGLTAEYGVPAELLELELTERSIAENVSISIQRILELQRAGFKVAIDDFGTGASTITYLAEFPINYIKLDTHLINRIGDLRTGLIIQSLIDMAGRIGVGLVAEGVETVNTFELLKSFKCPVAQGFLLGRPQPRNIAVRTR